MKIKKISITDFRGISGTLELDFTSPDGKPLDVVVLAGPNGCGKTTVLEGGVLSLAQTLDVKKIHDIHWHSLNNLNFGKRFALLKSLINYENRDREMTCKLEPNNSKDGLLHDGHPTVSQKAIHHSVTYFSSWRGPVLPDGVVLHANGNAKNVPDTEENRLYHIINKIGWVKLRRSLEDIDPSKPDEAGVILDKISRGWEYFYPERKNDVFEVKTQGEDRFNIFLKKHDFNELLPVAALSSGELEIFIMLGWFAINDFSDGIIFIDEPELHLHPAWQGAIIPALRAILPETQFIVATHSPQVIGSVKPYEVKLLPEGLSPEASYGLEANRILEDVMGAPARAVDSVEKKFSELFLEIDKKNLKKAKELLKELYEEIHSDPELVKAETLIRRKELIGK